MCLKQNGVIVDDYWLLFYDSQCSILICLIGCCVGYMFELVLLYRQVMIVDDFYSVILLLIRVGVLLLGLSVRYDGVFRLFVLILILMYWVLMFRCLISVSMWCGVCVLIQQIFMGVFGGWGYWWLVYVVVEYVKEYNLLVCYILLLEV